MPPSAPRNARDQRAKAFDLLFDAVVVTDLEGSVVDWNRGSELLYGWSRQEILGRHVSILHVPEDVDRVAAEVFDAISREGRWHGEIRMLHRSGRVGHIESIVVPVEDESGEVVGALGINRDITGRVEDRLTILAQKEVLVELDRAKTRFFTDLTHDLRTPLTLIQEPLERLFERAGFLPKSEIRDLAGLAAHSARRLENVVEQILEVAILDSGEMRLDRRVADLGAIARDVVVEIQPLARRRDQELTLAAPPGPMPVLVDRERVRRILENLISNAIKFTPTGGRIRCWWQLSGEERVVFVVQDSGPGIPAPELSRIFDRFYQGGQETNRRGSGLGLTLARDLAELHGGTLEVESPPEGGARFLLCLPRADVSEAPTDGANGPVPRVGDAVARVLEDGLVRGGACSSVASTDPAEPTGRPLVLLVEDDLELRRYLRAQLETWYRVAAAVDGEEGIRVAREVLPDLVLTDLRMPSRDGLELLEALRADPELEWIPVILLTGASSPGSKLRALKSRADDYLPKPFRLPELIARIENLIRLRRRMVAKLRERTFLPEPVSEVGASDREWVDRLEATLANRLSNPDLSVAEIAEAMRLDRTSLYRKIQEVYSVSPSELVRSLRLEKARELLCRTRDPVGSVAESVGFRSVSHFSRVYRERFGVTPTEDRARRNEQDRTAQRGG